MLCRRHVPALLLASTLAGLAPSAAAAPELDPNVLRALELSAQQGPATRMLGLRGRASVLIELDAAVTPTELMALTKAGVKTSGHRSTVFSRFVATNVDRTTVSRLLKLPQVRRIAHVPPRGPLPLDHTTQLIETAAARGAGSDVDQLTGRGMLVADTDSNADVFHPHFFHGDAGYYDWIDVDEDGVFEPGVDAIDLDADGEAAVEEIAQLLRASTYARTGDAVAARPGSFDPGLDWVFLDENDNGRRDYGAEAGFDDSVPAFGEPLLVPDDANANGLLERGERFVRLGTSKFRKVYTSTTDGWFTETRVYERGIDLTEHQNELTDDNALGSDASHGTGVLSILLGDVPLLGRRWVGIAPEAEVVLAADLGGNGAKAAAWMLEEKPDVALWEMAPWTGMPLDGTDPYSQLLDVSAEENGVAHACPVGNTGGSRKHAQRALPAGQTTSLSFDIPTHLNPFFVQVSLNIRGAEGISVRLRAPDATDVDVTGEAGTQIQPFPGIVMYPTVQTTSRGTYFVDTYLYAYDVANTPLPVGTWELTFEGHDTKDGKVDAYVMDDASGWGPGVTFHEEFSTDATTIGSPAVADHCIAVGAFTGHPSTPAEPWFYGEGSAGSVRDYSGRGPRIDGEPRLDIVAPDNPFAAAPRIDSYYGGSIPDGAFWVFGGTSGAGPHVAGVATLLAQTGVRGDAARDAIRAGAIRDATTQSDPDAYGAGRLSAAGALGLETGVAPPTVTLSVEPSPSVVGEPITLVAAVSDAVHAPSSMIVRWDDGYDGTWDTEYAPALERVVVHEAIGRYPYKVRVRNPSGRVAETVLWLEVEQAPVSQPDAGVQDAGLPAMDTNRVLTPGGGCGCRLEPAERGSDGSWWLASVLCLGSLLSRRRRALRAASSV